MFCVPGSSPEHLFEGAVNSGCQREGGIRTSVKSAWLDDLSPCAPPNSSLDSQPAFPDPGLFSAPGVKFPGGAAKTEPLQRPRAWQCQLPNRPAPVPAAGTPLAASPRGPSRSPAAGPLPASEGGIVFLGGSISPLVCLLASSGLSVALPAALDARSSSRVAALSPARTMGRAAGLAAAPRAGQAAGEGMGTAGNAACLASL